MSGSATYAVMEVSVTLSTMHLNHVAPRPLAVALAVVA